MTINITLKEFRPQLPKIMREVESCMQRFLITKRGHPCAVIISHEDFEAMLETIEILQDKAGMARLKKAKREVKNGKTKNITEVRRFLGRL